MNIAAIFFWVEEIVGAGPDVVTLFKDVVRAFNDFRAGKLTADEFGVIIDDVKKVATTLFATKAPAA